MMMQMSRESRKIIDELNRYANEVDVQGIITPAHIYMCDTLILQYYTAPILNIIKSRMSKISKSKREYKHFTIDYWYPIICSMIANNNSARRDQYTDIHKDIRNIYAYNVIIDSLILSDYSIADTYMIHNVVNTYSESDIIKACGTAIQAGIYNIRYVDAILQRESAISAKHREKIGILGDKIDNSSIKLLNNKTQSHSIMDIATAEYNWKKKSENADIERMFNEMVGNEE